MSYNVQFKKEITRLNQKFHYHEEVMVAHRVNNKQNKTKKNYNEYKIY